MQQVAINLEPIRVLLVEDEELTAKLEIKLLESYGYRVFHVISGKEALNFLKKNFSQINIILMDIDLGMEMDGTETARRILEKYNIPILFLSSHTEKEIVAKTEKVTSYGYVVKNSGITVLDASIKMAFKLFYAYQEISNNLIQVQKLKEKLELKEKELQKSEEKFYKAFYFSPAALVVSSLEDGKILEVNSSWTEILGYTYEESVGKTFQELGLSNEELREEFLKEIESKKILKNREYSLKNKFGQTKHFHYSSAIHEIDGKKYLFSSAIDVTNEKEIYNKILEHQRKFEQVFENTPNLFFKCKRDGTILKFIAGKSSELYTSPETFSGRKVQNILPEPASTMILESLELAFQKNQTTKVEYSLDFKGDTRYYQANLTPFDSEQVFAIIHDITEQKNHTFEIERLSRFYNFSRKLNELLISKDNDRFFKNFCQIAIEYGKFLFAWIGILENNKIIPKCFHGKEEGYLDFLQSISLDDPFQAQGPTATAIQKGEIVFCNDIETDPKMIKWREEALKRGYFSSVAIPFHTTKISGTLNLYSDKKNIFHIQELEILKELQQSLCYVLGKEN